MVALLLKNVSFFIYYCFWITLLYYYEILVALLRMYKIFLVKIYLPRPLNIYILNYEAMIFKTGRLRDKIIEDKFMFPPSDDKQKNSF